MLMNTTIQYAEALGRLDCKFLKRDFVSLGASMPKSLYCGLCLKIFTQINDLMLPIVLVFLASRDNTFPIVIRAA